jgi:hypothetical protein
VAAAFAMPHDGNSANRTTRIAMPLPATALLPNPATIRISATQLVVEMKIWKMPVPDSCRIEAMTPPSMRRCSRRTARCPRPVRSAPS